MTGILDQALTYAKAGWPVFPCRPGHKVPATRHGCHDATTGPDQIRAWWRAMPDANVAIATGDPGPDVVDVDRKGDRNGLVPMERLRRVGLLTGPVALVSTPSGGVHLYYWGTEQGNGSLPRYGIDFRGKGGYVLAPPSVVDGKPYELVEQRGGGGPVDWAEIRRFFDPPRQTRRAPGGPYASSSLDRLAAWVAEQPQGNRNHGLYWAAARAIDDGYCDTVALEPLVTAAIVAGLPETEARATIASAVGRFGNG